MMQEIDNCRVFFAGEITAIVCCKYQLENINDRWPLLATTHDAYNVVEDWYNTEFASTKYFLEVVRSEEWDDRRKKVVQKLATENKIEEQQIGNAIFMFENA